MTGRALRFINQSGGGGLPGAEGGASAEPLTDRGLLIIIREREIDRAGCGSPSSTPCVYVSVCVLYVQMYTHAQRDDDYVAGRGVARCCSLRLCLSVLSLSCSDMYVVVYEL